MDEVPPAAENSPLVRCCFAAIFVAACLYDLKLGVRLGGALMLLLSLYQALLGRVALIGLTRKTKGYVKGPIATAMVAGGIFVGVFLILAADTVVRLLTTAP
jgi:hypothetical protein